MLNALYLALWGAFSGIAFWLLAVAGKTPVNLYVLFGFGM